PEDGGPARADVEDGSEATVAAPVDELGSEKTAATPVDGTETMDIEEASDEAPAQPAEPDADEGDPVARDGEAEPIDEADPTPDDGEFDDATVAHEAVPSRGADLEPPDDTGPIPLRRGSQRRYVPRSDRDEELGGDAVRVLGRDRPRASPLPPPPDADPGPPVGPDGRTLVLAAFAAAALLLLIVLLL
ncbi:MAG: hypothetical protein H0V81_05845, partial [Solirubrobacterales bacterium]|nr:hypothetical protein [Solirubrobacterales bacterium]